jgi:hypothetical protein
LSSKWRPLESERITTMPKTITERPMLFSGRLVRSILSGDKTQTRRPIKWSPVETFGVWRCSPTKFTNWYWESESDMREGMAVCHSPFGVPGDRIWVRETFAFGRGYDAHDDKPSLKPSLVPEGVRVAYRAHDEEWPEHAPRGIWRPSLHMPRWCARILLEVESIRFERLGEMSAADAIAEGAPFVACEHPYAEPMGCTDCMNSGFLEDPRMNLSHTWDEIYLNQGLGWSENPWVWAITFKIVEGPKR